MGHRNLDGRDSLAGLDNWITREEPLPPVWATSQPIYGYTTFEWIVKTSDGGHQRFKNRFDALCFVNDHGTPSIREQLAASLKETQERTAYRFEEADTDRTWEPIGYGEDQEHFNRERDEEAD